MHPAILSLRPRMPKRVACTTAGDCKHLCQRLLSYGKVGDTNIQRIPKACMSNQLAGPLGEQSHVLDLQPTNIPATYTATLCFCSHQRQHRNTLQKHWDQLTVKKFWMPVHEFQLANKLIRWEEFSSESQSHDENKKWECGNGEVGAVLLSVLFRLSSFLASPSQLWCKNHFVLSAVKKIRMRLTRSAF